MDDSRKINLEDPFREAREGSGILKCPFQGEDVPMILRHADVRAAAKDWKKFSSDAPFRVPIPSEEKVRSTRQLQLRLTLRFTRNTARLLNHSSNGRTSQAWSPRWRRWWKR